MERRNRHYIACPRSFAFFLHSATAPIKKVVVSYKNKSQVPAHGQRWSSFEGPLELPLPPLPGCRPVLRKAPQLVTRLVTRVRRRQGIASLRFSPLNC